MSLEPGHASDSGYNIYGTVVTITGFVGVFLLHFQINATKNTLYYNECTIELSQLLFRRSLI